MPEVSQKEIGQRLYHVHREKRAEAAMKKIRDGLGDGWKSLTGEEIRSLGLLLQCTWNLIDQKTWETIRFNRLTTDDIRKILSIGKGYVPKGATDKTVIEEIKSLLLAKK